MQRDEIYLIDLWRMLARQWRWFTATLIVTLAVTFAFLHAVKPQWQATAWIQIGQVGNAPTGQDPKAEPLLRVIERLQLIPFQDQVLSSIGVSSDTPEGALYRKSLKLEPMPYAGPLVKLSVRAQSPQQAAELATATVAQLQAVHRELEAAPLQLAHARLDEVQADLQKATAERDGLLQAASQDRDRLSSVLLVSVDEEIQTLKQTRGELLVRLGANYTYDTSLVWPVYVPTNQAFPNAALIWGAGLLLGLFFGMLVAIARDALCRARAPT
ncbi:Wzz/FepE/Etk N-terminal domain-containing protein [Dyella caseinilytica]|uniref:Lipopolysaccharide biosynthesis protein n=1 Tax=Dyella caseinilytica TaxID=1849581 RepID=A0ABX7GYS5_9GAMM|nr:Wzz/FepE/Etk N-terminal domain-containing protein [Dyella caseinilytica]QRN55611.1 lipopolysaccharide biosynthesis protein [Dyella caseinilytica]GGA03066.1 chain-length determining protein [Dyella caseinilytica]